MRKLKWGVGVLLVIVLLYAGVGIVVYSRNAVPAINVPPRAPLPPGNVYDEYLNAVRATKFRNEILALTQSGAPAGPQRRTVLAGNNNVLSSLSELAGRPSVVTELEQGPTFVASVDFPYTSRLSVLQAEEIGNRDKAAALRALLDAAFFTEGVLRGGAILHLDTGYHASIPLFPAFPPLINKLSATEAEKGANEFQALLRSQGPLSEIFRNERRVRNRIATSIYKPDSMRGFNPGFLWLPSFQREYLMKPKGTTVQALDDYLRTWEQVAERPYRQFQPPSKVRDPSGLLNDETLSPSAFSSHFVRYHWRTARLRLIYSALRLEQTRKRTGRYPASLSMLGNDPFFLDPYSGEPFRYRAQANTYVLYSVGPNGSDDGGVPMSERSLRPNSAGDLLLQPLTEH